MGVGAPGRGALLDQRAARITEPEQLRALVQRLARGVVARGGQHRDAPVAVDPEQQGVAARHDQAEMRQQRAQPDVKRRRLRRVHRDERRPGMPAQVTHPDQRHAPLEGQRLGRRQADGEAAGQPRALGDGHLGDPVQSRRSRGAAATAAESCADAPASPGRAPRRRSARAGPSGCAPAPGSGRAPGQTPPPPSRHRSFRGRGSWLVLTVPPRPRPAGSLRRRVQLRAFQHVDGRLQRAGPRSGAKPKRAANSFGSVRSRRRRCRRSFSSSSSDTGTGICGSMPFSWMLTPPGV